MNDPLLFHFTHIDNLSGIVRAGLQCDATTRRNDLLQHEVGNAGIKELRRGRRVHAGPGGMVSDYVPFYYAPRSPMLFVIGKGSVPGVDRGTGRIIYLVTSVETLSQHDVDVVFSDRNAALDVCRFTTNLADAGIDWPLMRQTMWNSTDEYPDRKERRMAECLAWGQVPWEAITEIGTASERVRQEVSRLVGDSKPVHVRGGWYF